MNSYQIFTNMIFFKFFLQNKLLETNNFISFTCYFSPRCIISVKNNNYIVPILIKINDEKFDIEDIFSKTNTLPCFIMKYKVNNFFKIESLESEVLEVDEYLYQKEEKETNAFLFDFCIDMFKADDESIKISPDVLDNLKNFNTIVQDEFIYLEDANILITDLPYCLIPIEYRDSEIIKPTLKDFYTMRGKHKCSNIYKSLGPFVFKDGKFLPDSFQHLSVILHDQIKDVMDL